MKYYFLNIILFLGVIYSSYAQTPTSIENFSIKDGLSQSAINCIYQSSDGILWFGTQDGLNEYDGYKFTIFKYNPENSNSLSNNYINDITEDKNGNLLIGSRGGLTIWNRTENKFTNFKNENNSPNSISDNNVLQVLYLDSTIWVLTKSSLDKYIGDNTFEQNKFYVDSTTTLYTYNSLDLTSDSEGNIWLATKDGINVFYPDQNNFYRIYDNGDNSLSNKKIRNLLFDKNFNLWIGTFYGLNKFNKNTGRFFSYFYNGDKNNIRENTINNILIDNNGVFWIGTKNGLKTFNNENIIDFDNEKLNGIKDQITSIVSDLSGNIWIGTIGNGLYKVTTHKPKFTNFSDFPRIADKTIFGIWADEDNIWAGSNGLYIIDKKTKKIIFFNDLIDNDSIQEVTIYSFLEVDNKIWAGTDYNVFIIDKKSFEIKNIFEYFDIPKSDIFFSNRVLDIAKDKEGIFWFATKKGLIKFDGEKFTTFKNNKSNPNSISSNNIIKLLIDNNKIWIATDNGLNLFNKKTETFQHWQTKDGLPSLFILDFEKIGKNTLWISTTSGLAKMNIKNQTFKNFTSLNFGFKNDFFYDILLDKNNILWLTSNYGIVKFNSKNYSFDTYEIKDGLSSLECNIGSAFIDKNYNFYFGSTNGLNWCNMSDTNIVSIAPNTIITKIEKESFNEKNEVINFPDSNTVYNFKYKNVLTISFTMPEYSYPNNNKFQYKIEGISDNWSNPQTKNSISLTGISPGTYTVWVRGANSDGIWNNMPSKVTFYINPPFSRSSVAFAIYILIFLSLFAFAFWYVYRNIKKENTILQDKNNALEQVNFQRTLLEEKNKDITDSINYAKKIIDAILPPQENLKQYLAENFIYFSPKDIVSGDFYWFTEKNNNIFIAAVDCTGHGIPGAFMSIIGINLLESIVDDGITDPAIFLNMMNKEIINTLKKNLDKTHLKDGMDMTMCIIDKRRKQLKYAGAYNPAYIIRDGSIIQLKGDRKSVGTDFELNPFTPFSMKIRENDIIYVFSDGFTDQFGEKIGKKFKFKRFRLLLLSIYKLPMEKQKQKLMETFSDWKGNTEQIDDVLVIGFKPISFESTLR